MKRVGVFIDGSNLLWASKANGWQLDYQKLKKLLDQKYSPGFYNYYGVGDLNAHEATYIERAKKQTSFHNVLEKIGYKTIIKPLKYIKLRSGEVRTKGDIDIELVMGMIDTYLFI